jgi:hypothetical protein
MIPKKSYASTYRYRHHPRPFVPKKWDSRARLLLGLDFIGFVFLPAEFERLHGANHASEALRDTTPLSNTQTLRDSRRAIIEAAQSAPCADCRVLASRVSDLFDQFTARALTPRSLADFGHTIGYPLLRPQIEEVIAATLPTLAVA